MKNIIVTFAELVGANSNPRYELKIATIDSPADMLSSQIKTYVTYIDVPDLPAVLAKSFAFHPTLPTVDTIFPESHFSEVLDKAIAQVDFDFLISNTPSLEIYKLENYGVFEVYAIILNNLRIESRSPYTKFLNQSFNQSLYTVAYGADAVLEHILREIDNKQIPISR